MNKIGVNNKKGITLIALVLTIIVLLLLAGISISMLSGQDGILAKASKAKQNTQIESEKEKIKLAVLESMFDGNNTLNKDNLSTELSKYFNNAKVNGDSFPVMIEIGDNIYKVNADGTVDKDQYGLQTLSSKDGKITLTNLSGNDVVNYKISGNSIQDGTPTPTAPIEIESVGDLITDENDPNYGKYNIPIKVSGKNLFDTEGASKYSGFSTLQEKTADKIVVKQATNAKWVSANFPIPEDLAGKEVTISATVQTSGENSASIRISWMNGSSAVSNLGYIISPTTPSQESQRISVTGVVPENTTENKYKLCLLLYSNGDGTEIENNVEYTATYSDIQIEVGNALTDYEPYYEPSITNIYLDEPLRNCGNGYDDCIEYGTSNLTRKTLYFDNILDGIITNLPTRPYKTDPSSYLYATWGNFMIRGNLDSKPFSNHFIGRTSTISGLNTLNAIQHATEYNRAYLDMQIRILEDFGGLEQGEYLNLTDDERLELINNFMITNEVDYQVGTSNYKNTEIDLREIKLHEGTNIIEIVTDVKPSNMEITYYNKVQ